MEPQSDPILSLLAEVKESAKQEGDVDPALIERAVSFIDSLDRKLLRGPFVPLDWKPERMLTFFAALDPSLRELFMEQPHYAKALEYIARIQAALKEKKENG